MDTQPITSEVRNDNRVCWFATTSDVKYDQYREIFGELGWRLERATVFNGSLVEPQLDPSGSDELTSLVGHPLRQAARFISRSEMMPYIVEDTMLFLEAISKNANSGIGLPGADTKSWWINIGAAGVAKLAQTLETTKACFICQLGAYLGGSRYVFTQASIAGLIVPRPRSSKIAFDEYPRSNPHYFHTVFQPEGSKNTLAEMNGDEFAAYDYRRRCAKELISKIEATAKNAAIQQLALFNTGVEK